MSRSTDAKSGLMLLLLLLLYHQSIKAEEVRWVSSIWDRSQNEAHSTLCIKSNFIFSWVTQLLLMCYDVHCTPEHKALPGVKYAERLCLTCCSKSSLFSELSFCISTKYLWYARSENFRQIHCLAANWHSHLYRSEIMRKFANLDRIMPTKTGSWCQLTYSRPIPDFLSLFNL